MSDTAEAFNRSPSTSARFLYIIEDVAKETLVHLTNCEEDLTVTGLPAADGADPQVFTSSPITHTGGKRTQEFQNQEVIVLAPKNDGNFSTFFLSSITSSTRIKVMRIASYADNPDNLVYGVDTLTVEEGIVDGVTFTDDTVGAKIVPQAYAQNFSIPRHWFTRTCNYALYGEGCGLSQDAFKWDTTVVSIDRPARRIEVLGQNAAEETYWAYGTISHDPTAVRATIVKSEHLGNGNTRITTNNWLPYIADGDGVRLLPGCRRIPDDCRDKFNNAENFGGFPYVPNRNPAENGV